MDQQVRVYVDFAPEIKDQLGDRITLGMILEESGIAADTEWHALPPTNPEERSKALVETVMITAVSLAAAVKLVESAITHFLDHKAVRDTYFGYWRHEPMVDGEGKPVLDKSGKERIIRRWVSGFDAFPDIPGEGISLSVSRQGFSVGAAQASPTRTTEAVKGS